jgi:hypothetical protein
MKEKSVFFFPFSVCVVVVSLLRSRHMWVGVGLVLTSSPNRRDPIFFFFLSWILYFYSISIRIGNIVHLILCKYFYDFLLFFFYEFLLFEWSFFLSPAIFFITFIWLTIYCFEFLLIVTFSYSYMTVCCFSHFKFAAAESDVMTTVKSSIYICIRDDDDDVFFVPHDCIIIVRRSSDWWLTVVRFCCW